jgi:hypothetical protein
VVAVLVLGTGVLALSTANRSGNVAHATEQPTTAPPPAPVEESDPVKRIEKRLAELEKQKKLLDAKLEDLMVEKQKLEDAQKEKDAVAAELGSDLAVVVTENWNGPSYTVREVIRGKIGSILCSDTDVLAKYLSRAFNDPKGPKKLRVHVARNFPQDQLKKVFEACALAGFQKVSLVERVAVSTSPQYGLTQLTFDQTRAAMFPTTSTIHEVDRKREIDLTKYAPKKP